MATAAATANYNTDYYTSYAKAAATSAADPLRDYYGHAYYQVVLEIHDPSTHLHARLWYGLCLHVRWIRPDQWYLLMVRGGDEVQTYLG